MIQSRVSQKETYRRVVALHIVRLLELRQDVLREDLTELNTHLVYTSNLAHVRG